MDIATVLGLIMGMVLIVGSIAIGAGGLGPFFDIPSIMITVGGSTAALLINFPMKTIVGVFGVVRQCFFEHLPAPHGIIQQFKELAAVARRDGLLALEDRVGNVDDSFLTRGLEMVIGGAAKEDIQVVMETELSYIDERHKMGKKVLDSLAAAAPAFGMIGTLIGLVQMLRTLDDPSMIGLGMATALLTTLYGALLANLFCIPMAGKLETRNKQELMVRELMLAGMLALAEGQPPRAIEGRLTAFLAPQARVSAEAHSTAA